MNICSYFFRFVPTSEIYHFLHTILRLVNHRIGSIDIVGKRRLDIAMSHEILEHFWIDSLLRHARTVYVCCVVAIASVLPFWILFFGIKTASIFDAVQLQLVGLLLLIYRFLIANLF